MARFLMPALAVCLLLPMLSSHASNGTLRSSAKSAKSKSSLLVTPQRSAAVMAFVKQHHPELGDLLVFLKDNLPEDYNKAIRELFRTSERLARLRDNDEARYALELQIWQTNSRAQLLTAHLRMSPNAKLETELRNLLELHFQLRVEQLENDRARAVARVHRIDEQIELFKATRQQMIDRHLRQLAGPKRSPTITNRSTEKTIKESPKKSLE